jgi:hypothetical protein
MANRELLPLEHWCFNTLYLLHTLQLDFDIFLMFHISKYDYGKIFTFLEVCCYFFEINEFVWAGGGVTRPYKSVFRRGAGRGEQTPLGC